MNQSFVKVTECEQTRENKESSNLEDVDTVALLQGGEGTLACQHEFS